jgi:hypothetical protein
MKSNSRFVVVALCAFAMASSAFAAEKTKAKASTRSSEESVSTRSESSPSMSDKRWGLGFQTFNSFGGSNTALSAIFDVSPNGTLQPFFTIGSTSPFNFGMGAFYRHTLAGGHNLGFHAGGGLGFGSVNAGGLAGGKFFLVFNGMGGFHFTVPEVRNVVITLDGGPILQIVDGNTDFSIRGLSSAMGFGIHYLF